MRENNGAPVRKTVGEVRQHPGQRIAGAGSGQSAPNATARPPRAPLGMLLRHANRAGSVGCEGGAEEEKGS